MDAAGKTEDFGGPDEAQDVREGEAVLDFGIYKHVIGFPLKLAWVSAYNLLASEFGDSGVTPQRFSVLELISCNPGSTQTELGNALRLSRPATSLIIDFWQDRDCVERRPSPRDRRSFGIYLTETGKGVHKELQAGVNRAEAKLSSRLSEDEIPQLLALLAKLRD